jgi:tetratricopeptide (TPR) repeat protein
MIIARAENEHLEDIEIQAWKWEQEETEKQVFHLRSALAETDFRALSQLDRCSVVTNLANMYNTVGRFVEAIEYWERAITIDSSFGMAYGNKGIGLVHYAYSLYDPGHRVMFLRSALSDLKATDSTDLHPEAREVFRRETNAVEGALSSISSEHEIDLYDYPLGDSTQETRYRQWCLENRLFLNPLNDLGPYPIAARDILSAPDIVYGLVESPYYHGYFDQVNYPAASGGACP